MFGAESFLLPPSLPLHLPPLTLDNLGLMDAPALLSLPHLPFSVPKGEWTSLFPLLLQFATLCPNTPLPQRENGYYLYSLVPSVLPSSFSTLFH